MAGGSPPCVLVLERLQSAGLGHVHAPVLRLRLRADKGTDAIANERRIGDGGRGAPRMAASCAFRASISAASSMVPNSSARLATMPLSWLASSGVSWPSATLLRRSPSASAQSSAVLSGRSGKWTGAPRREGIALSIKRRAALTSPSLVAASKRASNSVSMFWTTFRLKRSLACFVNVMASDFGRPPLFLGGGASDRGDASATSSVMAKPSYVHAETIAPLPLIGSPQA